MHSPINRYIRQIRQRSGLQWSVLPRHVSDCHCRFDRIGQETLDRLRLVGLFERQMDLSQIVTQIETVGIQIQFPPQDD